MFTFIFQTKFCILTILKWQSYFLESYLFSLMKSKCTYESHSVTDRVSNRVDISPELLEGAILIIERIMEFWRIP